jgi:hypothetical protein
MPTLNADTACRIVLTLIFLNTVQLLVTDPLDVNPEP